LLENTNRKPQMAGRFVSVPMILSDLERQDVRNHFFQADLNVAQVSYFIVFVFAQMRRAVCQRQLSLLF